MSRNRQLEPLKTVIATITSDFGGIERKFKVYYGNACEPLVNGEMLHLGEEDYIELLTKFLSDEECEYNVPSTSEVQKVSSEIANKYKEGQYRDLFENINQNKPNAELVKPKPVKTHKTIVKSEQAKPKSIEKQQIIKDNKDENLLVKIEEQQELIDQLKKQLDNSKEEEIYELTTRISQLEKSTKKSSRTNLLLIILFGILTFTMMYLSFNKADAYLKENDNVELHAVVHRKDGDEFVLVGTFKVEDGELVPNE